MIRPYVDERKTGPLPPLGGVLEGLEGVSLEASRLASLRQAEQALELPLLQSKQRCLDCALGRFVSDDACQAIAYFLKAEDLMRARQARRR